MPGFGCWRDTGYGMLHGGKKAVEDKPDCYGYLDNVEGFFKGRRGQEWQLHNMAL